MSPNLSNQEQNDLSMITGLKDPVMFSPFYQREQHLLADGASQVVPGGLYMMDDSGGIVSQIQNTPGVAGNPVEGTIDVAGDFGGKATIDNIGEVSAISYKFIDGNPSVGNRTSDDVSTTTGSLEIINLTKITNDGLTLTGQARSNALLVKNNGKGGGVFYVYNVANRNSQLVVVHTEEPHKADTNFTETEVNGMVYVEYQPGGSVDSNAYIGVLQKVGLKIRDPRGIFRFDPPAPTA